MHYESVKDIIPNDIDDGGGFQRLRGLSFSSCGFDKHEMFGFDSTCAHDDFLGIDSMMWKVEKEKPFSFDLLNFSDFDDASRARDETHLSEFKPCAQKNHFDVIPSPFYSEPNFIQNAAQKFQYSPNEKCNMADLYLPRDLNLQFNNNVQVPNCYEPKNMAGNHHHHHHQSLRQSFDKANNFHFDSNGCQRYHQMPIKIENSQQSIPPHKITKNEPAAKIGAYTAEERAARVARFHAKRNSRIWRKKIKYDCRKKLADSRPRLKGRFVTAKEMSDYLAQNHGEYSGSEISTKAQESFENVELKPNFIDESSDISSDTENLQNLIGDVFDGLKMQLSRGERLAARKAATPYHRYNE